MDKREFAKIVIDKNSETFIVYMSALEGTKVLTKYFSWATQIVAL